MSLRYAFAIFIGLGLAVAVFLIMTLVLSAVRGADFLSPTVLSILGVGCLLVVARPAWAISGQIMNPGK
ncbi:hypothetical protein [Alteriqipengyuania sp.]|uniref:hypothetical protein n=1 Tax=Alteriqipengyuania sp. TaxID=2800692 RepID=UPI003515EA06